MEFYFLFFIRSILGGPIGSPRHHHRNPSPVGNYQSPHHLALPPTGRVSSGRGRVMTDFEDAYEDDDMDYSGVVGSRKMRRVAADEHDAYASYGAPFGFNGKSHSGPEAEVKPWFGLLMFLRKYPDHFFINT